MAEIHKSGAKPQASLAAHAGIGVSHGLAVPLEAESKVSFKRYSSENKVLWPCAFAWLERDYSEVCMQRGWKLNGAYPNDNTGSVAELGSLATG